MGKVWAKFRQVQAKFRQNLRTIYEEEPACVIFYTPEYLVLVSHILGY